jgi:hypothetical protein
MGGILSKAAEGALGLTPEDMALGTVSVASLIFNTIKGAKTNNENQENLNTQVTENEADYNNSANKSFLETYVAKDQVKRQDDNLRNSRKAVVQGHIRTVLTV